MKNETGLPIRPGKNEETAKFGLKLNKWRKKAAVPWPRYESRSGEETRHGATFSQDRIRLADCKDVKADKAKYL